MTCEEFVDSLRAFRDDELTSPGRIRAQAHLTDCERCYAYLRGYERTIELAKKTASDSGGPAGLPENLVRRIMVARRRSYCWGRMQEYYGRTPEHSRAGRLNGVHPDDSRHAVATWRRSVKTAQPYDIDHRLRRADGVYRWFHASGFLLRDAENTFCSQTFMSARQRKRGCVKTKRSCGASRTPSLIVSTCSVGSGRPSCKSDSVGLFGSHFGGCAERRLRRTVRPP
jgi:PAS domain-containing protein